MKTHVKQSKVEATEIFRSSSRVLHLSSKLIHLYMNPNRKLVVHF